jgi:hypothetical protein
LRDPNQQKIAQRIAKHDKGKAASFGELDVLATLWAGAADAIKMADPKNLAGKSCN